MHFTSITAHDRHGFPTAKPRIQIGTASITSRSTRAYTLLELLAVIVIMSILFAVATPYFASRNEYAVRAARDELRTVFTQAEQLALNDPSRHIQLEVSNDGYALKDRQGYLLQADGSGRFPHKVDSSIQLSPEQTWAFDANGNTQAGKISIHGEHSESLCVETTGYAHGCQ